MFCQARWWRELTATSNSTIGVRLGINYTTVAVILVLLTKVYVVQWGMFSLAIDSELCYYPLGDSIFILASHIISLQL